MNNQTNKNEGGMSRRSFLIGTAALVGAGALGIKGAQVAGEVINGPKPEVLIPEDFMKMVPVLSELKKIYDETKGQDKVRERFERLTELMFNLPESERKYVLNISLSLRIKLSAVIQNIPQAKIRFDVKGFDKSASVEHPRLTKDENSEPKITSQEAGESVNAALIPFIDDSAMGKENSYASKEQIVSDLMKVMDNFNDLEINNEMIDFVRVPYSVPPQGLLNKFLTEVYKYNGWDLPDLTNLDCEVSIFLGEEPTFWFQLYNKQGNRMLSFSTASDGKLSFATTLAGPDSNVVADYAHGYQDAPIWEEWQNSGRLASSEILGQVLPQIKNIK